MKCQQVEVRRWSLGVKKIELGVEWRKKSSAVITQQSHVHSGAASNRSRFSSRGEEQTEHRGTAVCFPSLFSFFLKKNLCA